MEEHRISAQIPDGVTTCTDGADTEGVQQPLPGVSTKTWNRFRELQKRREQQCRRSTARRIDDIKSTLIAKIKDEFANADELHELKRHNVDLSLLDSKPKGQNTSVTKCQETDSEREKEPASLDKVESEWRGVKQFIDVNSHLCEKTGGSEAPQSKLELTINKALAMQEYEVAEQLSDRLANREFGTKIAEAFDAKKFAEKRKREEMLKEAAKKKKLGWGFEHKKRWETKGNM